MQDPKKSPKIAICAPSHNFVGLYIFATTACIDNRKKKLVKQQYLPYMSPQYGILGPLADEILLLVWDTPDNFNRFRVLAALLHGTLVVGVSQTAALNRGCHIYSAGRPSRWALAHISSFYLLMVALCNRVDHYIFILFMVALCNRADHYIFAL